MSPFPGAAVGVRDMAWCGVVFDGGGWWWMVDDGGIMLKLGYQSSLLLLAGFELAGCGSLLLVWLVTSHDFWSSTAGCRG